MNFRTPTFTSHFALTHNSHPSHTVEQANTPTAMPRPPDLKFTNATRDDWDNSGDATKRDWFRKHKRAYEKRPPGAPPNKRRADKST